MSTIEQPPSIESVYQFVCNEISDINEHIPDHKRLAEECDTVVEIGVRSMVSTWGFIHGLRSGGKYIGIDLNMPNQHVYNVAKQLADSKGIQSNIFIEFLSYINTSLNNIMNNTNTKNKIMSSCDDILNNFKTSLTNPNKTSYIKCDDITMHCTSENDKCKFTSKNLADLIDIMSNNKEKNVTVNRSIDGFQITKNITKKYKGSGVD